RRLHLAKQRLRFGCRRRPDEGSAHRIDPRGHLVAEPKPRNAPLLRASTRTPQPGAIACAAEVSPIWTRTCTSRKTTVNVCGVVERNEMMTEAGQAKGEPPEEGNLSSFLLFVCARPISMRK